MCLFLSFSLSFFFPTLLYFLLFPSSPFPFSLSFFFPLYFLLYPYIHLSFLFFPSTSLFSLLPPLPPTAVVEHVRDGATLRVILLPSYTNLTLAMSGVKVRDRLPLTYLPLLSGVQCSHASTLITNSTIILYT